MDRAILAISGSAAGFLNRPFGSVGSKLATLWHDFAHPLLHPYRPERHYMRGPGPACRAKTGSSQG